MLTAPEFLVALRARGVSLEAHGARLRVEPAWRLTPTEIAALRANKPALLALLSLAADLEREGEGARVRALYNTRLSDDERRRLKDEARTGDATAAVMLLLVLPAHGSDA